MPANTKKYATWVAAAFVAFYVFKQPEGAAQSVGNVADGLASAADSLATFVNALA